MKSFLTNKRILRDTYVIYQIYSDERCSSAEERRLIQQLSKDNFDEEYLLQKISMLQLRLDENQKSLQLEREYANF